MSGGSIHAAARDGDLERVKAFVAQDPSAVNADDQYRWRPLFHAGLLRRAGVVAYLLDQGADVAAHDGYCLHFAAEVPHNKDIVRLLILNGALDPYTRPADDEMRQFLAAVFLANASRVDAMLARNPALVHTPDGRGYLPLHRAAQHGDVDVMDVLIRHGADVNARAGNGQNALYCAVGHAHLDAVQRLLAEKVDTSATLSGGQTPLQWAHANVGDNAHLHPIIQLLAAYDGQTQTAA